MEKEGGNREKMRKCRESISLHFLIFSPFPHVLSISSFSFHFLFISSFSLNFLFISSFSLHFLAARLQCSNVWLLIFFVGREAFDPVCKGPALWNFGISDEVYFFLTETRSFHGVKSVLPFSKLIIVKSQVFSARLYVYLHGYTQIRDRGASQSRSLVNWWMGRSNKYVPASKTGNEINQNWCQVCLNFLTFNFLFQKCQTKFTLYRCRFLMSCRNFW